MSTCEPLSLSRRPASAIAFRTQGCVLLDDMPMEEDDHGAAELEARRKAELEAVRRSTLEAAQQQHQKELAALRQQHQEAWKRLNDEMDATLKQMTSDIRHQLIEMSVRISEIIICHKLPDADMIRSVLDEVLSPISDLQGVRVRLAPGALKSLTGGADPAGFHPGLECVEDPELKTGDVMVESRNGIFDGKLSSRLQLLAEALAQPPVDRSAEA